MSTVLQGSRCLCVAPLRPWDTSVLPSSAHTHYLVDFVYKRSNHSHMCCWMCTVHAYTKIWLHETENDITCTVREP